MFSERLLAHADACVVLLVISSSGISPNVLEALLVAGELYMRTMAWVGFGVGRAMDLAECCVHVAIDDYSRLAYVEVLANEEATTTAAFLRRALAFFRLHGIRVPPPAHRQRQKLHRPRLPGAVHRTQHPPPSNQTLQAVHKRQGRTLHPDAAQGMGL